MASRIFSVGHARRRRPGADRENQLIPGEGGTGEVYRRRRGPPSHDAIVLVTFTSSEEVHDVRLPVAM